MNPRLQAQLMKLGRTLANKNNQPIALYELRDKRLASSSISSPRVAQSPAEAAEPVFRKETAVRIEEAVESFSERQVIRMAAELKPLALRIYGELHLLGCTVAHEWGYHRNAGQVSFFCPAEAICAHLGKSLGSFYRSLKGLIALGLVDVRGHKTTLHGRGTRCDGTLWAVKLFPKRGSKARLHFEDFKATYRDLEADIASGKTVYQQMRGSSEKNISELSLQN